MKKLLLTSAGITNAGIHNALLDLLDKPIAECNALAIGTAAYTLPFSAPNGAFLAWRFLSGQAPENPMVELGWKSVGILELTALPGIGKDLWSGWVQEADVILVSGGDPVFLHYWMRESGLADFLPSWNGVWVGFSAGSLVVTPKLGEKIIFWENRWTPPTNSDSDKMLGIVDFAIFPHVDYAGLPDHMMADAEKWAAKMTMPCYAIDDETAIKVVDGTVEVISEGNWRLFTR